MISQFDQFTCGNSVLFVGVMRMGADRAIDIRKSLRDCEQRAEAPDPRRDGDDAAAALATMASRSSAKSGKSRWQWLSTSIVFQQFKPPMVRRNAETPVPARAAPCPARCA